MSDPLSTRHRDKPVGRREMLAATSSDFEGLSSDGLCHPWYGREVKLQHITGSLKQKK